jgi:hypothetical protein
MHRWILELHERDVAEKPPTSAEAKFKYDANLNCGVLVDNIFKVSIYGKDFESVVLGLFAYSTLRAAPTSGDYNFQQVKKEAWELLKKHLGGATYIPKET